MTESVPSTLYQTGTFDFMDGGQYLSSDVTTPSSGLPIQYDLDAMPMPMDSLGAMIDMPANFDWASDQK